MGVRELNISTPAERYTVTRLKYVNIAYAITTMVKIAIIRANAQAITVNRWKSHAKTLGNRSRVNQIASCYAGEILKLILKFGLSALVKV